MQRKFEAAFRTGSELEEPSQEDEVCFGALYGGAALPISKGRVSEDIFRHQPGGRNGFATLSILAKGGNHFLQLPSTLGDFAVLDTQSTNRLKTVEGLDSIRFEAVIDVITLQKRRKGAKSKAILSLSINIYGPRAIASDAGSMLSEASGFLQHPKALSEDKEYYNPQLFQFPEDETNMRGLVGITNDSPSARRAKISDEINSILDSLAENPEGSIDWEYTHPAGLLSRLKSHQEHGVRFILQREDTKVSQKPGQAPMSSHAKEPDARCRNTVTPTNYGGIVADVMGLGKTLTVLTAILHSLPNGDVFRTFQHDSDHGRSKARTPATLVVVSSAQLLENWHSEIRRHFSEEALKISVFHGPNRLQEVSSLLSVDVVLTTYATIVAEEKGANSLQQLEWFRIVLDEAHWIRNAASKQFQSVSRLSARNRWCLTGTPIQNKLDDLASLATFLQLPPYPTKASFQKHILDPLFQGGEDFSGPLRSWLRAFCIRRTEKLLSLPKSKENLVTLAFSEAERKLYDQVLRQTKRDIDEVVSQDKSIKKYNILFTAILKMRMLCNSGTLPKSLGSNRRLGETQKKDTGCERCVAATDEDSMLLLTEFQFCPDCGRSLQLSSPAPELNTSCDLGGRSPQPALSPAPDTPTSSSSGAHSEKLSAVIKNITGDDTSKHIVFSYWTSTLDSLATLLQASDVKHVQVDGRTSYPERTRRLQAFKEDVGVSTLIMSIETGALGLNLTAANRVHLVEPQWNPSVEEQAIARALRMGQKREVTIFRYIMKGTVEQNIANLQKKKKAVAKFMFDADAATELDGKLEDLKFVLDMNSS